jgi:predicted O-methyltransferase YrrM
MTSVQIMISGMQEVHGGSFGAGVEFPSGDYVSPNLRPVRPDAAFPFMIVGDKSASNWPWFRANVPHNWYVDRRIPDVGFVSRDEAHILYNIGLNFAGKRALEIGCWLGWSACHLALGGVTLEVIDPLLVREEFRASVVQSLSAAGVLPRITLYGGMSPQGVLEIAARNAQRKWSLIFIDGDHEGDAPLNDAKACLPLLEPDGMVVFHDLAAPAVARGLDYCRDQGWNTLVYQTMQIMGAAWRGNVKPIEHHPDPAVKWELPAHLNGHPVSA